MTRVKELRKELTFGNKVVKCHDKFLRVIFQRKVGKHVRRLLLSKDAFNKMEDVSLVPNMRIELDKNIFLINLGNRIQLIKYCQSADKKQCDGGFFNFTPKEWQEFWITFHPWCREALLW